MGGECRLRARIEAEGIVRRTISGEGLVEGTTKAPSAPPSDGSGSSSMARGRRRRQASRQMVSESSAEIELEAIPVAAIRVLPPSEPKVQYKRKHRTASI